MPGAAHEESQSAGLTGSVDSHRSHSQAEADFDSAQGDNSVDSSSWTESPTAQPRLLTTNTEVLGSLVF